MSENHVAIYLPSLAGGGAERVMVTMANGIAARGYAVDLVLAQAVGPYLSDVAPDVRVVDLACARVINSLWPLTRYLRRERPAAMLAAMNHANLVAIMAHRLAGSKARLVISEHSPISSEASRAQGLAARMVYALVPRLYPLAHHIVAVSQDAARDLERFAGLAPGAVRAIYNPFDLDRIERLAAEPPPHPWLAEGQPPVIIGIGRLTEEKDFPTLIRAYTAIRARHTARLIVLGEGPLRAELQALIRECGLSAEDVHLPGFAGNPYAYLARSSLFVLSSRWEGFGNVLIEAMACGAPVVSTNCPCGPREILEDGRWGRLVPVGDVNALAQAMDEVLSTTRAALPDVRRRAQDFAQVRAIDAYLEAMGLPPKPDSMVAS